jgi:F-type H+-transporting ATPase subunit delta
MSVTTKQLAQALYEATEGKSEHEVEAVAKNTIRFLKSKNMASRTSELIEAYQRIWEKENGVLRARVRSRKELTETEKKEIESLLKNKFKAENVQIENIADEGILGGVRIEIGDTIMDATVNRTIDQLADHLKSI